jgi:hypothetical protein
VVDVWSRCEVEAAVSMYVGMPCKPHCVKGQTELDFYTKILLLVKHDYKM